MNLIIYLIAGAFAGYIASRIMRMNWLLSQSPVRRWHDQ